MNEQELLWDRYFTEDYLGFELTDLIEQVAKSMIYRPSLWQEVVESLSDGKTAYYHKPTIGASLSFEWDQKEIRFTRLDESGKLALSDFLRLLVLIDKIYGEFLPLGSVVQIKKDKLPSLNLPEDTLIHVLITGQRVCVDNRFYLDYTGCFWPNGLTDGQEPLVLSQDMIESVLFRGFEPNSVETAYQLELRRKLLSMDIDSLFFSQYQAKEVRHED